MDYEQEYKEAISRAKIEQETFFNLGNISAKTAIERIFPELHESEDEKIRKAMLGRKYDDSVSQKHKNYSATKSKEYWSEYFKNIPRKTRKVKNLITGVTYNSVKEAREKENITIAIMSRKLKEGKEYVYVD